MSRDVKLTPEIADAIVTNLSHGAFKSHAAMAAGVSVSKLTQWLERGESGEEPYASFATRVEAAIGADAVKMQKLINLAAQGKSAGDWKAAAWNLEKKYPKLYGAAAARGEPEAPTKRERPHSPWLKPTDAADANAPAPKH